MKRFFQKADQTFSKVSAPIVAAAMTVATLSSSLITFATQTKSKNALNSLLEILGLPVIVFGGFLSIMGIVHYAAANSEGDGPAKHKGVMQIASGIMVIVIGVLLKTDGFQGFVNNLFS